MDSYSIVWRSSASRELRAIHKPYLQKIINAVDTLAITPFPHNSRKLQGVESTYRLRVADYRVIYQIDTAAGFITICHVRHRKEVYR
ncbi:MAG: type II toxin-antitoxin system RelE/ParE family toxin [Deltaproteobacteria bacterium]|nr:type II toxin-antitoxin system RelE/ParE family toxin [Deltaproteobacteria bacterium]